VMRLRPNIFPGQLIGALNENWDAPGLSLRDIVYEAPKHELLAL
jgi:hypothetical protein